MLWKLAASNKFSSISCFSWIAYKNLIGSLYGCMSMDGHSYLQNQYGVE
jgi:hypothetical protein